MTEYTVESAFEELREMFPGLCFELRVRANYDRESYLLSVPDFKHMKEFVGPTLRYCMAQVKKWRKSQLPPDPPESK
jgi:hypothetical protein